MIVILDKIRHCQRLDFWTVGALVTLKILILNRIIDETFPAILTVLFSALYMGVLFSIFSLFPRKPCRFLLFAFYVAISFLLFADSIYFSHFGNLTAFFLVYQFGQVGDISGSIEYLVHFKNLLMVLDIIPVIAILMIMERKLHSGKKAFSDSHRSSPSLKLAVISILIGLNVAASALINRSDLLLNTLQQEYFTYHIADVVEHLGLGADTEITESDVVEMIKSRDDLDYENSPYYGVASGMNFVNIQLESFQNFLIDMEYNGQEVTPNLNALLEKDSIYFDNFFQQIGRGGTSDSEFTMNNSIFPSIKGPTYMFYGENTYYGLPWILKSEGYQTFAFHGYEKSFWDRDRAYPIQGIDNFISIEDYSPTENVGWGLSDEDFFEQSASFQKDIEGNFYAMMLTLTSHHPYNSVSSDNTGFKLKPEHEGSIFGNYLISAHYTDQSFGRYLKLLKESGLYENTMIALYGDHFGITRSDKESALFISKEALGGASYDLDHMTNTPLIVHIPNSNIAETVSHTGSNIDFMPTLLHLLGLKDPVGFGFGKNLLFESNIVPERSFSPHGSSFITEDVLFDMSNAGMFETGKVIDRDTRKELDLEDYRAQYEAVIKRLKISDYILEHDYVKTILKSKDLNFK